MVKLFGYITFSIDGKIQNGKIHSTIWDIFVMLCGSAFISVIIYVNFTIDLTLIKTKSFIIDQGNRLTTLFIISNVLVSSIINGLRRYEIWNVFKNISDFDKKVNKCW